MSVPPSKKAGFVANADPILNVPLDGPPQAPQGGQVWQSQPARLVWPNQHDPATVRSADREALLKIEIDKLRQVNGRQLQELDDARAEHMHVHAALEEMQRKYAQASAEATEVPELRKECARLNVAYGKLEHALASANEETEALGRNHREFIKHVEVYKRQMADIDKEQQREITRMTQECAHLRQENQNLVRELEAARQAAHTAKSSQGDSLHQTKLLAESKSKIVALKEQLSTAHTHRASLENDFTQLQAERASLENEFTELQSKLHACALTNDRALLGYMMGYETRFLNSIERLIAPARDGGVELGVKAANTLFTSTRDKKYRNMASEIDAKVAALHSIFEEEGKLNESRQSRGIDFALQSVKYVQKEVERKRYLSQIVRATIPFITSPCQQMWVDANSAEFLTREDLDGLLKFVKKLEKACGFYEHKPPAQEAGAAAHYGTSGKKARAEEDAPPETTSKSKKAKADTSDQSSHSKKTNANSSNKPTKEAISEKLSKSSNKTTSSKAGKSKAGSTRD